MLVAILCLVIGIAPALGADPDYPLPGTAAEEKQKVLLLIRHNRQKYGEDAAMMQGLLLMHANQGEAVATTASAIVGFEEIGGKRYVGFRVASGVIFEDRETDRDTRLHRIWHSILERTLFKYPSFSVPADGVAVEIGYNHRPYASVAALYETIDEKGPEERAKFYLLTADFSALLEHRIGAQELLERSRILLDDQPVKIELVEPMGPFLPTPQAGDTLDALGGVWEPSP